MKNSFDAEKCINQAFTQLSHVRHFQKTSPLLPVEYKKLLDLFNLLGLIRLKHIEDITENGS